MQRFNWTDIDLLPEHVFYDMLELMVNRRVVLDSNQLYSNIPDGGLIIPASMKKDIMKPVTLITHNPHGTRIPGVIRLSDFNIISSPKEEFIKCPPGYAKQFYFKTKVCKQKHYCVEPDFCSFYHSDFDKKTVHQNMKSIQDKNHILDDIEFQENVAIISNKKSCLFGSTIAITFNLYKTKLCKGHEKNKNCSFAHSENELRTFEQNVYEFWHQSHPLL